MKPGSKSDDVGLSFSPDTMVCTGCCATLDNIITFLFRCLTSKKKKNASQRMMNNEAFLRILEVHPEILQQMLSTVLNIIMFEDCRNQWSMSRPLLGLILLNEDVRHFSLHCGSPSVPFSLSIFCPHEQRGGGLKDIINSSH